MFHWIMYTVTTPTFVDMSAERGGRFISRKMSAKMLINPENQRKNPIKNLKSQFIYHKFRPYHSVIRTTTEQFIYHHSSFFDLNHLIVWTSTSPLLSSQHDWINYLEVLLLLSARSFICRLTAIALYACWKYIMKLTTS